MTALTLEWRSLDRCQTAFRPQPYGEGLVAAIVGPPGRDGPQPYEYVQSVAAATWTINHNRGRWPTSVTVLSPGGMEIEAAITHVSTAQLVIDFAAPFAGSVRLI
jgi:hypothetical protein